MADGHPAVLASSDIEPFSSGDIEEVRSLLNQFYYPATLETPGGPDGFEMDLRVIRLGPLTLALTRFATAVTMGADELGAYYLALPTAGELYAVQAGREVRAGPASAVVLGPVGKVLVHLGPRTTKLSLTIEPSALEAELAVLLGRPVRGPIALPAALDLSRGPGLGLRRLLNLLRDEMGRPDSLIRHPLMIEHLRHSLLAGLLLAGPHRYHDELVTPARPEPPWTVRRALDAMQDEPERAFSVADLADIAGVSVRSLQAGFRRHVGCAPMTYLQQVRLDRAREALRASDPATLTVASVAHRWGFAHLGRFASVYRDRFGESPSASLRKPG